MSNEAFVVTCFIVRSHNAYKELEAQSKVVETLSRLRFAD